MTNQHPCQTQSLTQNVDFSLAYAKSTLNQEQPAIPYAIKRKNRNARKWRVAGRATSHLQSPPI